MTDTMLGLGAFTSVCLLVILVVMAAIEDWR